MRPKMLFIAMILLIALTACSDKAAGLYETAKFEELQNNREHARELYEEILRKYPESSYAGKARERLQQMKDRNKAP